MADSDLMKVGELAKRACMPVRNVRYYESLGLIEAEIRSDGGFRLYSQKALDRLTLIKNLKNSNFSLTDVRDLMLIKSLCAEGHQAAAKVKKFLNQKLKSVEADIKNCNEFKAKMESKLRVEGKGG